MQTCQHGDDADCKKDLRVNDINELTAERKQAKADDAPAVSESPRAVGRFLEIVDLIADTKDGLTLAQLSAHIHAPKSSLLAILRPLTESSHLLRVDDRYQLGPAVFRLASKVHSSRRFASVLKPIMEKLAAATGESVYFAVLDKEQQVFRYSEGIESRQTVRYAASVGATRPLYCGAGALILLAHQPREWVESYLRRVKLIPVTAATVVDAQEILHRLDEVRERRLAVSIGEAAPSAAGVAAPVLDAYGELLGAMVLAA
ncbi:MAG: IclR family transcriptional regulator, partial [Desulfobacterales bacterium]|nr:IclR family transcriptional regulator [Desulfobacterales bacterium]